MKMWAPSVWSTLAMYGLLSGLTYQVIQQWPDDPLGTKVEFRMPEWPASWPRPSWLGLWRNDPRDPKPRRDPAHLPAQQDYRPEPRRLRRTVGLLDAAATGGRFAGWTAGATWRPGTIAGRGPLSGERDDRGVAEPAAGLARRESPRSV